MQCFFAWVTDEMETEKRRWLPCVFSSRFLKNKKEQIVAAWWGLHDQAQKDDNCFGYRKVSKLDTSGCSFYIYGKARKMERRIGF